MSPSRGHVAYLALRSSILRIRRVDDPVDGLWSLSCGQSDRHASLNRSAYHGRPHRQSLRNRSSPDRAKSARDELTVPVVDGDVLTPVVALSVSGGNGAADEQQGETS